MIYGIRYDYNNYYIPVNYISNYSDRLDGLTDNISVEFYDSADLLNTYYKYMPIIFYIRDDSFNLIREYHMVASSISRQKTTQYDENNIPQYLYVLTLSEPSVLLSKSYRSDIAITPYAYDGDEYPTLWEAYLKVMSVHNMNDRNKKFMNTVFTATTNDFVDINNSVTIGGSSSLDTYASFTLELSTYSEQVSGADSPTGNSYSRLVILPAGMFTDVKLPFRTTISYRETRIYSNLETEINSYDIEILIDRVGDTISVTQVNNTFPSYLYQNYKYNYVAFKDADAKQMYNRLTSTTCPTLTYKDLSTYSQLADIFGRVGLVPYADYDSNFNFYVTCFYEQGEIPSDGVIRTIEGISSEETAYVDDYVDNAISSNIHNLFTDTDLITYPTAFTRMLKELNYPDVVDLGEGGAYLNYIFGKTDLTFLDNETIESISFPGSLVPSSYDASSGSIKDANNYYIELPTNIESIEELYLINVDYNSVIMKNNMTLTKVSDKIIEYSLWKSLPATEQKLKAYYVRGENRISQCVSLVGTENELLQKFPWLKDDVYDALKTCFVVAVYKPMIDVDITKYSYDNLYSNTTRYIDLPFKVSHDKQANTLLEFEKDKYDSVKILCKVITSDPNELTHFAGEKVLYKNINLYNSYYLGEFSSVDALESEHSTTPYRDMFGQLRIPNINFQSWAKIGEDVYIVDKEKLKWSKYIGNPFIITKMDVAFNRNEFEITYELSDKIVSESSIGSFSDNVRVSDNLSIENVVTRNIHINKTFLLNCNTFDTFIPENLSASVLRTPNLSMLPTDYNQQGNKIFLQGADTLFYTAGLYNTGLFGEVEDEYLLNNIYALQEIGVNFYRTTITNESETFIVHTFNNNCLWLNSNTSLIGISTSISPEAISMVAPYIIDQYKTNISVTRPLFLKKSDENTELYGFGNGTATNQLELNMFTTSYGFDDKKIDIREKVQVVLQYNIIPNNYKDFCNKHNLWDEYQGRFPIENDTIFNVKEINPNFEWLCSTLYTPTDENKYDSIKIYTIPKYLTINDFIQNNSIYSGVDCTGHLYVDNFRYDGDKYMYSLTPYISLNNDAVLNPSNENNYIICLIKNNKPTPLCIIEADGITPTNSITLSCFLQ